MISAAIVVALYVPEALKEHSTLPSRRVFVEMFRPELTAFNYVLE